MDTITQNYNNCPMLCPFTVSNFAHLFCTLLHDLTNISGVYNTTDNIRDVTFKLTADVCSLSDNVCTAHL